MKENQFLEFLTNLIESTEELKGRVSPGMKMQDHLKNDLGFDSIALMIILYELQEHKSELKITELQKWKLVKDIFASVESI